MSQQVIIYGAGGFGREVAWLAQRIEGYHPVCFVEDSTTKHGEIINKLPVMSLDDAYTQFPEAQISVGIGSPKVRQAITAKAISKGFQLASLIDPTAQYSEFIEMGSGTVICAGNILTTNIKLGTGVQINLDCTIGHDAILDDYTTLAPGAHVSGWVHMGKRVYIGTGATIINGTSENPLTIGDDAVIGAGACVTKSIPARVTAVGVPAKIIKASQ